MIRPVSIMTVPESAEALRHLNKPVNLTSLSEAQARTLIATDALAAIHAGKLTPRKGKYFRAWAVKAENRRKLSTMTGRFEDCLEGTTQQLFETMEGCEVCALGACFAAEIGRSRARPLSEVGFRYEEGKMQTSNDEPMRKSLQHYFSVEQLGLMESAFEMDTTFMLRAITHSANVLPREVEAGDLDNGAKAVRFGRQYSNDRDRLVAILENVISNCGTFEPQ